MNATRRSWLGMATALLVLASLGLACSATETEAPGALMLVLTTDAPATGSSLAFDWVTVVVGDTRTRDVQARPFNLTARDLPATLTIAAKPGQGATAKRVQIFAFQGESTLRVYREARVLIPPVGIEMLRMPLNVACDRVYPANICPPNQSCSANPARACAELEACVDGACEGVKLAEGHLPPYTQGAEAPCTPAGAASRCESAGRACGELTSADGCGEVKTVDCGRCPDAGPGDAGDDAGADAATPDATVDAGLDAATSDATTPQESGLTCLPGTYANGSACSACPSGTFSTVTNAAQCSPWKTCTAGEYVGSAGTATADRACTSCGAGTYSTGTNVASCTPCGVGTTSGQGAEWCTAPGPELAATTATLTGDGLNNCGAGGSDACARSLLVTGGSFYRGTDTSLPATVSDFRLDKYEVTVGRFRKFVDAWVGGWRPADGAGKHAHLNGGAGLVNTAGGQEPGWAKATWDGYVGAPTAAAVAPTGAGAASRTAWNANLTCNGSYATWTNGAGSAEKKPMNCLSWYDLHAFCIWDGGFLPSEAEWEYAAAGGSEERTYPWGSAAPASDTALAIYECYHNASATCSGHTNIAPVGTAPGGAAKAGPLDMAGSMWEWTLDWYQTYVTPCSNCTNQTAASDRVMRGGSFRGLAATLTAAYREPDDPANRHSPYGGRCARMP